MRLQIFVPAEILLDREVAKIVARARNGSFGILPRHVDFVTALAPGVLSYVGADGVERYVGTDEGVLVKCAERVRVATRNAVCGDDLEALRLVLRREIIELDEHERAARTALARLEAGVIRRFVELQERPR
jgi:F-type H+-transporting ATPase subunit epsilon